MKESSEVEREKREMRDLGSGSGPHMAHTPRLKGQTTCLNKDQIIKMPSTSKLHRNLRSYSKFHSTCAHTFLSTLTIQICQERRRKELTCPCSPTRAFSSLRIEKFSTSIIKTCCFNYEYEM